ncbi:hypothetical protein P9E34_04055 [Schinkia azotoformans]|uniref:hypothetical protein n=1 Tax=Schinkia azotoformans TaxID=1454 RepID=UPI002DBB5633|nr:hypothetical protein [Schinkia azotoformans]MEC1723919.1 hypothetical protein [Schinkia azotoformans]
MTDLKNLSHELDHQLSGVACSVETLSDIETLLGFTKQKMDDAAHKGEEKFYFHYVHREVRVLQNLLFHTLRELNENYKKARDISDEIFNKVVKNEKTTSSRQAKEVE